MRNFLISDWRKHKVDRIAHPGFRVKFNIGPDALFESGLISHDSAFAVQDGVRNSIAGQSYSPTAARKFESLKALPVAWRTASAISSPLCLEFAIAGYFSEVPK